jgi:ribonuclease HII
MRCAGVDEAGRGPLAGPVVAAAVILPERFDLPGLADSKRLSATARERLVPAIKAQALAWCVAEASVEEIDRLNILQATLLAMQRAVAGLSPAPDRVQVDGDKRPRLTVPVEAVVRGDQTVPAISAASVLAKVARDALLEALEHAHPGYGFAQHKGYPTAAHLAALRALGPCVAHRRSFAPVRAALAARAVAS